VSWVVGQQVERLVDGTVVQVVDRGAVFCAAQRAGGVALSVQGGLCQIHRPLGLENHDGALELDRDGKHERGWESLLPLQCPPFTEFAPGRHRALRFRCVCRQQLQLSDDGRVHLANWGAPCDEVHRGAA